MHHRTGYRLGAGCCWIRIYKGAEDDAPVVVCEQLPRVGDAATRKSRASSRRSDKGALLERPAQPAPSITLDRTPPRRRRGPGKYFLHTFPTTIRKPWAPASCTCVTLGTCAASVDSSGGGHLIKDV